MESVECFISGVGRTPDANGAAGEEWQSVPLEESWRWETECSGLMTEGNQMTETCRKLDYSMCGLTKFTSSYASVETNASKADTKYVNIKTSEDYSAAHEVRLSIHAREDPKTTSENLVCKTGNKVIADTVPLLQPADDECLPLLQQVRAFIKGSKLSCTGLLSGDGKPLYNGWSSLLQRCFSFKSSEASSEGESHWMKRSSSGISWTTSSKAPSSTTCGTGAAEATKGNSLLVRDPASRAEALPLAHYRPTDGVAWKEGDVMTVQSTASAKSPVHANYKKPPKPPRHPGRSASLDSATLAAQRAAKKCRDKASAKRKSRGAANAAASTGLTPLVALVLTIGFGVLMVFQGVFVQTNVSYGRNTDSDLVNVAANSRFSRLAQKADSFVSLHPIDPNLLASLNADVSKSEAILGVLQKSMTDLPWSRGSLISQVKSKSG